MTMTLLFKENPRTTPAATAATGKKYQVGKYPTADWKNTEHGYSNNYGTVIASGTRNSFSDCSSKSVRTSSRNTKDNQVRSVSSNRYALLEQGRSPPHQYNHHREPRRQKLMMASPTAVVKSSSSSSASASASAIETPTLTAALMPRYLCVLYVATGGVQGGLLGSDEEEIVLLIYVVIDSYQCTVMSKQQFIIRPSNADINENTVCEQLHSKSMVLSNDILSLEHAIEQFDQYLRHLFQLRDHDDVSRDQFVFVTDGQLPLRQCLHPEACKKNIPLPNYYNCFIDLHKEVFHFVHKSDTTSILQSLAYHSSIPELLSMLNMTEEADKEYFVEDATNIIRMIQRLLIEDHKINRIETVNILLEPGICSVNDQVDDNCMVRARGLPWQSSDQDIARFFRGLNIEKGGVALCLSAQGRRNGEALIRFTCEEHRDMALKRHRHHMGSRYIEVYRASGEDFLSVAGGTCNEAQAFLSRGAQVIIRMRGLPYDCSAKQVIEFFKTGENGCKVLDGEDGVLFVKKAHGRATGDAFVLFSDECDAPKALTKHRELIGSRYIELFRSTTAEVQQVLNRSMDPSKYDQPRSQGQQQQQQQHTNQTQAAQVAAAAAAAVAAAGQMPYLPQHVITSGTQKDCIRLRGLPYEAQVEHILDFLGEHAKNIVFQGVHMVYNAQGQPSGEAFIQMNSEQSAYLTASQRHHRFMGQGKKQRYIEVFQCSGEDMNIVLTGGISTAPLSPAVGKSGPSNGVAGNAATLLSPGGTLMSAPPFGSAIGPLNQPNFAAFASVPPPHPHPHPHPHQLAAVAAAARQFYPIPAPLFYWPYPSPPISPPEVYYGANGSMAQPANSSMQSPITSSAAMVEADCLVNVASQSQPQSQQLLAGSPPLLLPSSPSLSLQVAAINDNNNNDPSSSSPPTLSNGAPFSPQPMLPFAPHLHDHIMVLDESGRTNFIPNHHVHLQHPLDSRSNNAQQQQFIELLI